MASEIKVLWSDEAIESLESILSYLKNNWPNTVSNSFKDKLTSTVDLLKEFPTLGINSGLKKGIRKFVMSKHVSIFYEVVSNTIIIHYLFDNRQKPENMT